MHPAAAAVLAAILLAPVMAPRAQAQPAEPVPGGVPPAVPSDAAHLQALAQAAMSSADGRQLGTVAFAQTPHGVLIQVRLEGLDEGGHAFHVRERGACEAPSFASAGGVFDPEGRDHGFLAPGGPKAGNLPNLFAAGGGGVRADIHNERLRLDDGPGGLLRPEGTALVLHAGPDDYLNDPRETAGEAIACGVIVPMTQP